MILAEIKCKLLLSLSAMNRKYIRFVLYCEFLLGFVNIKYFQKLDPNGRDKLTIRNGTS